jgi:tetratricopeptide (TPR) repeat protein
MTIETYDVFISYSHHDAAFVDRLATDLIDQGIKVWRDTAQLRVGDYLLGRLTDGIKSARLCLAVISKNYQESEWCRHEIRLKLSEEVEASRVFVLPIRIDDTKVSDLVPAKVWADFRDESAYRTSLEHLLRSISYHVDTRSEDEKRHDLEAILKQIYVDACYGNRTPADAVQAFRTAATMNPECAWVWRGLGYILHYHLKDDLTAEEYYKRALELEPNSPTINYGLGKFYQDIGKRQLAEFRMNRASELGFTMQLAWEELGPVRYR